MDANRYINVYVDTAVGTIHEYLSQVLQLKTQLRIANDTITENAKVITDLTSQRDEANAQRDQANTARTNEGSELTALRQKNSQLEAEANALRQKSSHMDSCLNTITQLKKTIQERDEKIAELEKKLNPVKPRINRKKLEAKPTEEIRNHEDEF